MQRPPALSERALSIPFLQVRPLVWVGSPLQLPFAGNLSWSPLKADGWFCTGLPGARGTPWRRRRWWQNEFSKAALESLLQKCTQQTSCPFCTLSSSVAGWNLWANICCRHPAVASNHKHCKLSVSYLVIQQVKDFVYFCIYKRRHVNFKTYFGNFFVIVFCNLISCKFQYLARQKFFIIKLVLKLLKLSEDFIFNPKSAVAYSTKAGSFPNLRGITSVVNQVI